ncbi:hypothetical protein QA601_11585 [Chitinispirillales bacterium ANBcel5]|uniref:hypothetical protein n=1 Tax=Cellulosispirillum alkaliphilum TaxID=3039283 RepID=UPI002A556D19|nr:hypothetical protein [Chitinispirillales bacterium ANBcel5]
MFSDIESFLKSLSLNESFTVGSKKLASFFRDREDKEDPATTLIAVLTSAGKTKLGEYIVFSMLDTSRSDLDLLSEALYLRNVTRLLLKVKTGHNTSAKVSELIDRFQGSLSMSDADMVFALRDAIRGQTQAGKRPFSLGRVNHCRLAAILRLEAESMKLRLNSIADQVGSYDMRRMAKVLPLISIGEEMALCIANLAQKIETKENLGQPVMSFAYAFKTTENFNKWFAKVSQEQRLSVFSRAFIKQSRVVIPTPTLIALSSISRLALGDNSDPISWIDYTLEGCSVHSFKIDARAGARKLGDANGFIKEGTVIRGEYDNLNHAYLTAPDMLTKSFKRDDEPSAMELVALYIQNDMMLGRLLDNPRVISSAGVVEKVATLSRSMAILQKIASRRELHSGQANRGVVKALLKNPTNIPMTLLRPLINFRHLSLAEMKEMIRSPYGIRRQVYSEIKAQVNTKR